MSAEYEDDSRPCGCELCQPNLHMGRNYSDNDDTVWTQLSDQQESNRQIVNEAARSSKELDLAVA